ncbi:hypothetical protein BDB13_4352 [Rhodococcus sp. OK302]|nr:hypothetical protein BDB13_4352 [Rhodococcus sp. OK302]
MDGIDDVPNVTGREKDGDGAGRKAWSCLRERGLDLFSRPYPIIPRVTDQEVCCAVPVHRGCGAGFYEDAAASYPGLGVEQ